MESFLPGAKIGQVHGTLQQDTKGRNIFPVYHPAVALYNRNQLVGMQEDFLSIPKIINKLKKELHTNE